MIEICRVKWIHLETGEVGYEPDPGIGEAEEWMTPEHAHQWRNYAASIDQEGLYANIVEVYYV